MKLALISLLLLGMLACQPTLIYGLKKNLAFASADTGETRGRNGRSTAGRHGRRHAAESSVQPLYSPALSSSAKLLLSLDSGDELLVRAARGASADEEQHKANTATTPARNGGGKRQKSNNNRKSNRNASHTQEAAPGAAGGTRKRPEKKFSATAAMANSQRQPNNNSNNHNNGKGKQRQMLKSQNHQSNKALGENAQGPNASGEKAYTCRYSKAAWSDCDPATNKRSRVLNLKKGDPTCPATRTMERKCKPCRYEKGAWSECVNGQMTREDKLKATGGGGGGAGSGGSGSGADSQTHSCEPVRTINKKCNPNNGSGKQHGGGAKKDRKNKDKGSRRNQALQKTPQH